MVKIRPFDKTRAVVNHMPVLFFVVKPYLHIPNYRTTRNIFSCRQNRAKVIAQERPANTPMAPIPGLFKALPNFPRQYVRVTLKFWSHRLLIHIFRIHYQTVLPLKLLEPAIPFAFSLKLIL